MAKNTIEKAIYNRTELLLGDDVMELPGYHLIEQVYMTYIIMYI